MELHINDIWYGKDGTPYAGVTARIEQITTRNVQVAFDKTVSVDGIHTNGTVMTQKQFKLHFDSGQQLSLFSINRWSSKYTNQHLQTNILNSGLLTAD